MVTEPHFDSFAFDRLIPSEDAAIDYVTRIRLRQGLSCPRCDGTKLYTLLESNYKCATCGLRFSIKVGTIFHGTKLPIRIWLLAIWHIIEKPGISSAELARTLGVTQTTAWFVMNCLRKAMRSEAFRQPLKGSPKQTQEHEPPTRRKGPADLAMDRINRGVLSRSSDHPGDEERLRENISELASEDVSIDANSLRRAAIRSGWDDDTADRIVAMWKWPVKPRKNIR